jgi:hypothetical protein
MDTAVGPSTNTGSKAAILSGGSGAAGLVNYLYLNVNMSSYDTTGNNIYLEFYFADMWDEADPEDRVWIRGNDTDPWIEIFNWSTYSPDGTWHYALVNLTAAMKADNQNFSATTQIRFGQNDNTVYWGSSSGDGVGFDDISIIQPLCNTPSNLAGVSNAAGSVDLTWTTGGATGWQVSYDTTGNGVGANLTNVLSSASTTLTGLAEGLSYDFYVRDSCGSGPSDKSFWIGPITVVVQCGPTAAPYSRDFDGDFDGQLAACWNAYSSVSNGYARVENLGAPLSGSQQLAIYSGTSASGDTIAAISPVVPGLTVGDKQLDFFAKTSNAATDLVIATASSPDLKTSGFTVLDTIFFGGVNSYERIIYDISTANGYNGTDEYVVFLNTAGTTADYIYIDDFVYQVLPACPQALAPTLNGAASFDSVSVAFNANGGTSFEYEIGPTGFAQGTNTILIGSASTNPFSVTGLQPNTTYDIYVRNDCGANGVSGWTTVLTFTTSCAPFTAPYFNDFESDALDAPPTCWLDYETFSTSFVEVEDFTGTAAPYAGSQALYLYSGGASTTPGADTLLAITPQFTDLPVGDKRIRFQANSDDPVSQLWVGTISSPSVSGVFTPIDTIVFPTPDTYQQVIVDFTTANGYNGTDEYIVLAHNLGATVDYIRIDDFYYEEIPACIASTNFTQSPDSLSDSRVFLTWNAGQGSTHTVEWGASGFTPLTGTGLGTVTTTDTFADITTLTGTTTYDFYLIDSCGSDVSFAVGPLTITTPAKNTITTIGTYLDNNGSSAVSFEVETTAPINITQITNVFNSGVSSSDIWIRQGGVANAPLNGSGDLIVDNASGWTLVQTATVSGGGGTGSAPVPLQNMNPIYIAAGTSVGFVITGGMRYSNTNSPTDFVNGPVTLHAGGTVGGTLYGHGGAIPTLTNQPRGFLGSVAYELAVGGDCPDLFTNLTIDSISGSSVTIDWDPGASNSSFYLEYGPPGFFPGGGTKITGTYPGAQPPVILNGLSPETDYDFYLGEICNSGNDSIYLSGAQTFMTGPACTAPSNLGVAGVVDTGAALTWDLSTSNGAYEIWVGPKGFYQGSLTVGGNRANYPVGTDSVYLDTLTSLQCYEYVIRSRCGTDSSDWVGPFEFCTLCPGVTPITLPFFEGWESFSTPVNQDGIFFCGNGYSWGVSKAASGDLLFDYTASAGPPNEFYTGTKSAGLQTLSNDAIYLEFSADMSNYTAANYEVKMSFYWADFADEPTAEDRVWIRGSLGDPWIEVLDWSTLNSNDWQYFETRVDSVLAANSQTLSSSFGVRFGQSDNSALSGGDGFGMDDFRLEATQCPSPTAISIGALTTTTAEVIWTTGGASHVQFEYGPTGFTPGTGTYATGTTSPATLTSLTPGTIYDVYLRDSCAAGNLSFRQGPYTFTTPCVNALSGTITLGATGTYTTFADLANDLNICGVSGPVTVNVQAGSYTDHFHVLDIPGASVTNTVTIDGAGAATLNWDGVGPQGTMVLDGTDHMTISNMIIENDFTTTEGWGILLTGDADSNRIIDNVVLLDTSGSSFIDKSCLLVSGATDNDQVLGASVDYLTVTGNEFYGGYISVSFYGVSTTVRSENYVFSDNLVKNFYLTGVYFSYVRGIDIQNNQVISEKSATDEDGFYMLDIEDLTFMSNFVRVKDYAVYIFDLNEGANIPADSRIYNNMVISRNDFAFYLNDMEQTNVYHNTSFGRPGIYLVTPTDMDIRNNIFTSDNDFAFEVSANMPADVLVDYNAYYSTAANPYDAGTPQYATLADWVLADATRNANSVEGDPIFVSADDLHLIGGLANDVGDNSVGITTDIDGDTRPASGSTVVDMGADEYTPVAGDFALQGADFEKDGFCLSTNDTIVLYAENIIGSASDLSVTPLVANYSVTGPVNSSGTITLNTGTIALNDTAELRATNVDLSIPGEYTLNAYILPNADNVLAINDTLAFNTVTITIDSILTVSPKVSVLTVGDTVLIKASSPFFGGGDFHITEICHFAGATNGAPTGGRPSYLLADDYIEITGVPGADLAGYTLEQWNTSLASSYTFPTGTVMGPDGTAIFAVGQLNTSAPSPSDFYYHATGTFTGLWSSGGAAGRIIKDASGNIVDAVASNGFTFPAAANVPASEWSGTIPSTTSTWGERLEGPDLNSAQGWVSSATSPQNPNAVNTGVVVPAPVSVAGFSWSQGGTVTTTNAVDTVIESNLTPGTYWYIATFNSPCGVYTDSVQVIVPSCFAPVAGSITASASGASSAQIEWDTTGLGATTNYEIEFGPIGYTPGTGTSVAVSANNNGAITGLSNNVCVDVYVRTACGVNDFSPWSGPVRACPTSTPCDDLDAYQPLPITEGVSSLFIPWLGNAGDGAISTARAQSGTQSLHVHDTGSAAATDVVAYFDTISNGAWDIDFSLYVETGAGAYFNIQQNHVPNGVTGTNLWGGDVYFQGNGTASVTYGNPAVTVGTFNYAQGQWIDMKVVIDLDNDSIWMEYNGSSTGLGWDYSIYNGTGNPLQFNGVNFYSGVITGGTYDINYFMDDFCITPRAGSCPAPNAPTAGTIDCDNFDVNFSSSTGSSLVQYGPAGFTLGTGTYSGVLTGATSYNIPGVTAGTSYDVYVANICASGDTSNFAGPLTVVPTGPAPVASFTYSVNGFTVNFDGSPSTGSGLTYTWDFGDGNNGTGMTPNHTYATGGNFTVTLTVTNACGTDDTTITATSISLLENALGQSLQVYPNPTNDRVHVAFATAGNQMATIRVLELSGKEVLRINANNINGTYTGTIDLSDLARGVYMLEIGTGDLTATRRLIKN